MGESDLKRACRGGEFLQIRGLLKNSLIDYPGEICATLFTGGCNLRCPFCFNRELVLSPESLPLYPEAEVLAFLTRRAGLLGGICISGGEPTLQQGLADFAAAVKAAGLKVKLDTNGTQPLVLQALLERGLLDYVAVDIKAPRGKYSRLAGVAGEYETVAQTVALLLESAVAYEFRTTFVPGLLQREDLLAIAAALAGCRRYVLQKFKPAASLLDPALGSAPVPQRAEMEELAQDCRAHIETVVLRGF